MKNPFIKTSDNNSEYIDSTCSINRLTLARLPIYGIDDEMEGKTVSQVFSTHIIAEEIKKRAWELGVDIGGSRTDGALVSAAVKYAIDGNAAAIDIIRKFGRRLGIIFLTLKLGMPENRAAREDWDDECWEYWQSLKRVILVGGLTSGVLGSILKAEALSVFKRANVEPYDFVLFDNATYVGIMGGASQIKAQDGAFAVFDFGQTNLKRSIVKKRGGEVVEIKMLDSLPSKYMTPKKACEVGASEEARKLNLYLRSCIFKTITALENTESIGDEIIISIANYVCNGRLQGDRAGYAKLSSIIDNYSEYLENELSGMLRRSVKIRLLHDSTAAALYFKDYKDSVCITVGTAFGVGFPEINP